MSYVPLFVPLYVLCPFTCPLLLCRLRTCSCNDSRKKILEDFVTLCHPNWKRSTYVEVQHIRIRPAPSVCSRVLDRVSRSPTKTCNEHVTRFRGIISFVPKDVVERLLHRLECIALEPQNRHVRLHDSSSGSDDSLDSDTEKFSNPPSRVRGKRKSLSTHYDDDNT